MNKKFRTPFEGATNATSISLKVDSQITSLWTFNIYYYVIEKKTLANRIDLFKLNCTAFKVGIIEAKLEDCNFGIWMLPKSQSYFDF